MAWPIAAATGRLVLTYNIILILSFFFCAWGMYPPGRPSHTLPAGGDPVRDHVRLLSPTISPTSGISSFSIIAGSRSACTSCTAISSAPTDRDLLGAAAMFVLQALSCAYYGLYLGFVLIPVLVFFVVKSAAWRRAVFLASGGGGRRRSRPRLLLPVFVPYIRTHAVMGFERSLADVQAHSAELQHFLAVPPSNLLWGRWLGDLGNHETQLFPGPRRPRLGGRSPFFWRRRAKPRRKRLDGRRGLGRGEPRRRGLRDRRRENRRILRPLGLLSPFPPTASATSSGSSPFPLPPGSSSSRRRGSACCAPSGPRRLLPAHARGEGPSPEALRCPCGVLRPAGPRTADPISSAWTSSPARSSPCTNGCPVSGACASPPGSPSCSWPGWPSWPGWRSPATERSDPSPRRRRLVLALTALVLLAESVSLPIPLEEVSTLRSYPAHLRRCPAPSRGRRPGRAAHAPVPSNRRPAKPSTCIVRATTASAF